MPTSTLEPGFWITVEDCLIAFHRVPGQTAVALVNQYRRRLLEAANTVGLSNWMEDMVYHTEPWQLACTLTDDELDLSLYRAEYEQILLRNGLIGPISQEPTASVSYPDYAEGNLASY